MGSPAKEGSLARTEMVGPVPLHTYGDGWMIDALPSASKQAGGINGVCSMQRNTHPTSVRNLPNHPSKFLVGATTTTCQS